MIMEIPKIETVKNIQTTYQRSLEKFGVSNDINKEFILDFLRDCQLGKTIKGRQKKKIGFRRLYRIYIVLTGVSRHFGKRFDEVAEKEMEGYIYGLDTGQIKTHKGTPYTEESLASNKKIIKKFYKWLFGYVYAMHGVSIA